MNRTFVTSLLMLSSVVLAQTNPPEPSAVPSNQAEVKASDPTASPLPADDPSGYFEVSSFKLNEAKDVVPVFRMPPDGDSLTASGVSIRSVLRFAFEIDPNKTFGVHGQPGWVNTDHYDIQAKIAPGKISAWQRLGDTEKRHVLRDFLIHALALKYHMDDAIRPFYALTVVKSGLKMTEDDPGKPHPTGRSICHWMPGNSFVGESCGMEDMSDQISHHTDLPVLDKTGLQGKYTFTLVFDKVPDPRSSSSYEESVVEMSHEDATPVINSGLKRLGLELVPGKGRIDGIVIESIQRPPSD